MGRTNISKINVRILTVVILLFLVWPFLNLLTASLQIDFLQLDVASVFESVKVTVLSSIISILIIVIGATPISYYLSKSSPLIKQVMHTILQLPMMIPPAMIGLILLLAYGNQTPFGQFLAHFNQSTSFSLLGVVLVNLFVSLPVYIKSATQAFESVDPHYIQTALILGDNERTVFKRITLPLAKRGLIVATLLAFCRGISEFGATIMFAGNLKGITQTMPLAIYNALETNADEAIILALILLLLALLVVRILAILTNQEGLDVKRTNSKKDT